jgi:hypothetical protein
MLGGGFGLATYADRWRDTKDIDFYILPRDQAPIAKALVKAGFSDYYPQLAYDRGWIYRSVKDGVIVDMIWSMANRRATVDESWFERARTIAIREKTLAVIPPEELLWCKLYVMQRDHCDWLDVLNLLYAAGPSLIWEHLLGRVGQEFQLLQSCVQLFDWLSPNRAAQFPARIRKHFRLPEPVIVSPEEERRRVRLLDSRAWFAPFQSPDAPMEV